MDPPLFCPSGILLTPAPGRSPDLAPYQGGDHQLRSDRLTYPVLHPPLYLGLYAGFSMVKEAGIEGRGIAENRTVFRCSKAERKLNGDKTLNDLMLIVRGKDTCYALIAQI